MNLLLMSIVIISIGLVKGDVCDPSKCKNYLLNAFYSELNCKPVLGPDNCCPVRYECPEVQFPPGPASWCSYRGKVYPPNAPLNDENKPICSAACTCSRDRFICATIDCAEGFGLRPRQGCHFKYELNECCSVGQICEREAKTCTVDGTIYFEGQKVNSNDHPCETCICQSNGEIKCKIINCGIELYSGDKIEKKCAPKYFSKSCCPIAWICPTEETKIIPSENKPNDEHKCKFGNKELSIGDMVEIKNDKCTKCSCTTPPMVTCILEPDCEK